ncbi:hypothetical protein BCR37DRAFT_384372 [Protomyces lactucae-debilis]|uniref:MutL C-terminal dimerisation domain-containing protein n=1 Tax=Protomyces lactucae-debilis TaxID=2754530 RepID=A0A1Y2ESN2_PROLT|nr:uncharacterized protein BCR37DRAFT_384372 [Protomyces lactucae-debilis]ORY74573.1 hypothetical protein BCR37DRAFT_384372 [Protomyces lactucae-debilis]
MPTFLFEAIQSRSCRSAIMFNDELDHQQMENLVHALGYCHLPFQCAHGRPSLHSLMVFQEAYNFDP